MDSVALDEFGNCIKSIPSEQLLSIKPSYKNDVFGDIVVHPRIGDAYQVDIPSSMKPSNYLLYTKNRFPHDISMEKRIPIVWNFKGKDQKLKCRSSEFIGQGDSVVPGDSWSVTQKANFLFGLYVFKKNFVQVKRLIEGKKMGDILSFYYGKFYKSRKHRRWSACRKMRSKKSVCGQDIFSGSRQLELLSRMLPHVSEEGQNSLLKVSKKFELGEILFEDYIFSLKTIVGMHFLVAAVGIGKGKKDMTRITMESLKPNPALNIGHGVPTGKAFASLTLSEIVTYLCGDYRLSKARSNDLFWEAVWPRLLARGWQSEEPANQIYTLNSKQSLVFLIPGIENFSRRTLVKGTEYFDSIADVLSKVASEPGLLELDSDENEGNQSKEEHVQKNEEKLEQGGDLPERQRHLYFYTPTPVCNTGVMKFTVVDTSLADDGKNLKVRQLSTLPEEISNNINLSEDSDGDDFEDSTDEGSEYNYPMLLVDNVNPSRTIATRQAASNQKCFDISADGHNSESEDEKHSYKRKLEEDNLDPVVKRHQQLSSCNQTDTIDLSSTESIEGEAHDDSSHGEEPFQFTIDLHIESEPNDNILTDASVMEGKDGKTSNEEPKDTCIPKSPISEGSLEREPNVNSRRQGTRNRPPTLRALEAIAHGYLTSKRRRSKTSKGTPTDVGASSGVCTANGSQVVEGENGACNGGNSTL